MWMGELRKHASSDIAIAIVGNKVDLANDVESRAGCVTREEGAAWASAEAVVFFETSAKTGLHVGDVFIQLGASLVGGY
jgi:Ras-related protein Rab-5C